MKNIPKLFGFPVWINLKQRVAKKHLSKQIKFFLRKNLFSNYKIGNIVNDCTSFNGKIKTIDPDYQKIGQGYVLSNIDFFTENTGCSLINCGIEPKQSREVIEHRYCNSIESWLLGQGGKTWFGGENSLRYQKELKIGMEKYNLIKNGGHICDEDGILLPEFKRDT